MDLATRLFQFSFGVEPNKATLQNLAGTLNEYVASLAEKQKALEQYAASAKPEQFLSSTPLSSSEKQKLLEQYVKSPQGKKELEDKMRKQQKAARQPILWQIPEEKMNELKWQRTQLMRLQREQAIKKGGVKAGQGQVKKVTDGPVKRVGNGSKQIPKLGTPKSSLASAATSKAPSVASKAPSAATNPAKKALPNGAAKTPQPAAKVPQKAPAKPKVNGVAK